MTADNDDFYREAGRRIEYLTLALGAAAALVTAVRWGRRAALGFAIGSGLAWVNYRWLKQGVDVLAQLASAQADAEKVRIPKSVYLKFFGRFALLLGIAYVILSHSLLPAASILAGLFALIVAVLVELLYELVRGERQPDAG